VIKITIPTFVAKIGVPFIKVYAKITKQEPLYTFDSLRTLREVNTMINCHKAETELGYRSRDLEVTIRDTMHWFKENGFIK
jgi:dihydroflavonol-4-reductase